VTLRSWGRACRFLLAEFGEYQELPFFIGTTFMRSASRGRGRSYSGMDDRRARPLRAAEVLRRICPGRTLDGD